MRILRCLIEHLVNGIANFWAHFHGSLPQVPSDKPFEIPIHRLPKYHSFAFQIQRPQRIGILQTPIPNAEAHEWQKHQKRT
jgi:hypothetical protein